MIESPSQSILVVDDEPIHPSILSEALGDYPVSLMVERDGEMALKRAKESQPGLILLDVLLPGMNFEVCVQLKSEPLTRHIPVIFISVLTDTEQKLHAFKLGAVDYITKPFDCHEASARIILHLDHCRLCRQQIRQRFDADENVELADSSPENPQVKRAKPMLKIANYLRQHLDATPCLDQLASFVATNRTTLNHDFHQIYGMSVFDWLKEQRLLRATELLRTTELSVLDIAGCVGYTSHSSFSKVFLLRFGVSPREYRRRNAVGSLK